MVNFTSAYEKINKCSDTLHAYGKSMKVHKIFHLRASVKTKQSLKYEIDGKKRDGQRQSDFRKKHPQRNNKK